VYYCRKCNKAGKGVIVSKIKPEKCPVCGLNDIYQDEDVLDTWFSSWLWPFATFKDKEDLKYFYPTSTLVTAQEIIFFWVARMIMAGFEFMDKEPFKDVYIHGTVRDDTGKKMSKSLGNIIDPLEIINEFGADALRFSIISITSEGQDIFLSKDKFQSGRNFANKIWNASRYVLSNLSEDVDTDLCVMLKSSKLSLADRWILSNLYIMLQDLNKALDSYKFNEAANLLYEFIWHKYCDWYLELVKPVLLDKEHAEQKRDVQIILYKVLEKSLRMLHPFMPFITEEVWGMLPHKRQSIMIQPWPHVQKDLIDKDADSDMDFLIKLIVAVRNIRSEMLIPLDKKVNAVFSVKDSEMQKLIEANQQYIKNLAKVENIDVGARHAVPLRERPKQSATAVVEGAEIFIPLAGLIDVDAEKIRLSKKVAELDNLLKGISSRLKNKEFLNKAPAAIVEKEKQRQEELKTDIDKLKSGLKILG